ncbi:MAG: alpha-ketoglutarate-dependent dioxygenase AlkB [Leptospira sp.]|nr:alpha-ketoglutarate-dependent dioxygenase AlkB [Leptospira sp.]
MSDLFPIDRNVNLLPFGGIVNYFGPILNAEESSLLLNSLLNETPWKYDEAVIFGKHIYTKRKVAWFGDAGFSYHYSGIERKAIPWTDLLLNLKSKIETYAGDTFNSCLLNLYHDGDEGMAWHSDDEKELGKDTTIASLTLGAERRFLFRHKINRTTITVHLENGSLLLMKGETQTNWLHSLPKMRRVKSPRINLTFRKYGK